MIIPRTDNQKFGFYWTVLKHEICKVITPVLLPLVRGLNRLITKGD